MPQANPTPTPESQLPQSASAAPDSATLQGQIQQAMTNETTLANSSVKANVTDSEIELTGMVPTRKDKQTAMRIAESYAGSRKVVDHLKVSGKGGTNTAMPSSQPPL